MSSTDVQVYGIPISENIRNGLRIYSLSMFLAIFSVFQWICIGYFSDWRSYKMSPNRYGYWLAGTFFGICMLSCTDAGRKVPFNLIIVATIFETSTLVIGFEQQHSRGVLINIYTVCIVVSVVIACIVYGAYLPMRYVPSELMLSLTVATFIIMLIVYFINSYFFEKLMVYYIVKNSVAVGAAILIMYTASIIHDRQFNVPKSEYLYLSVLIFFGHIILHERILSFILHRDYGNCD